jgi:3-deoxy-D-manno-octulosonic-acid transferase
MALAQTADDARRLTEMGAPKVRVCGNVKFDMTPAETLLAQGASWRQAASRPLVLAASTREGEEPGLLLAWQALRDGAARPADTAKAARLFIVPRHPQRFDEVAGLITAHGFTLSRRSQWTAGMPDEAALRADVWLGDSMGEMPAYYASARVALLGGSFAPLGGQNLIEAAACGCPVIMGGSTFNFADAAQLSEAAGAAFRVKNWPEAVKNALDFCDMQESERYTRQALDFARAHRGAASSMASTIWGITSP